MTVRRKRITKEEAVIQFKKYLQMPINYLEIDWVQVVEMAMENDLTYYDAAYVWLALEKKAELLTLDEKMKKVFGKLKGN